MIDDLVHVFVMYDSLFDYVHVDYVMDIFMLHC